METTTKPIIETTDTQGVQVKILEAAPLAELAVLKPRVPADSIMARATTDAVAIGLLLELAIKSGQPITELIEAQKQILAMRARQSFAAAMNGFQSEITPVPKTHWADMTKADKDRGSGWGFSYVPLDVLDNHIRPVCRRFGLSHRFDMDPIGAGGMVSTRCIVRHVEGHEETTSFYSPASDNEFITKGQRVAVANTFNCRIALMMAYGLAKTDNFDNEELLALAGHGRPAEDAYREKIGKPRRRADAMPAATPAPVTTGGKPFEAQATVPAAAPARSTGDRWASTKQCELIKGRADRAGVPQMDLVRRYKLGSLDAIPAGKVDEILVYIASVNP